MLKNNIKMEQINLNRLRGVIRSYDTKLGSKYVFVCDINGERIR
jgi:hypothetical protein